MSTIDQAAGVALLCGRLADHGISFAAISPGSRSAPLALALSRIERIECVPVIDERSAAFVALGAAKQTGLPALVVTTSGTAAANLAPAVHEAHEARVPLIVMTADRPPELRHVGEGQTIDQVELFGSAACFLHLDDGGSEADWLKLADRAVESAIARRPGPVQINLALRPPLEAVANPSPPQESGTGAPPWEGTSNIQVIGRIAADSRRPLLLAGRDERGGGNALAELAEAWEAPLLADPLSGARPTTTSIEHWDCILRCPEFADAALPDLIIRVGDMPTSKPLRSWLAAAAAQGSTVVEFDPEAAERDPLAITTHRLDLPTAAVLELAERRPEIEPDWKVKWQTASTAAAAAVASELDPDPLANEPAIARALLALLGPDDTLLVSASMPIRDLEAFSPKVAEGPRVLANRGANGIDGVISTGIGMALAGGRRVTVLIGDVAFAHDHGALMLMRDLQPNVRILLIDNGAGTIFDTLPVASEAGDAYERFFATPTRLPVRQLATAWDLPATLNPTSSELSTAISDDSGPSVIHLQLAREDGHLARNRVHAAVAKALRAH